MEKERGGDGNGGGKTNILGFFFFAFLGSVKDVINCVNFHKNVSLFIYIISMYFQW